MAEGVEPAENVDADWVVLVVSFRPITELLNESNDGMTKPTPIMSNSRMIFKTNMARDGREEAEIMFDVEPRITGFWLVTGQTG